MCLDNSSTEVSLTLMCELTSWSNHCRLSLCFPALPRWLHDVLPKVSTTACQIKRDENRTPGQNLLHTGHGFCARRTQGRVIPDLPMETGGHSDGNRHHHLPRTDAEDWTDDIYPNVPGGFRSRTTISPHIGTRKTSKIATRSMKRQKDTWEKQNNHDSLPNFLAAYGATVSRRHLQRPGGLQHHVHWARALS